MKHVLFLLFIATSGAAIAQSEPSQSPVQLRVINDRLTPGDTLHYTVQTEHNADLEIAVFSDHELIFHERTKLSAGVHPYTTFTNNLQPGKYFVLVTGKDIHEQHVVQVKAKK